MATDMIQTTEDDKKKKSSARIKKNLETNILSSEEHFACPKSTYIGGSDVRHNSKYFLGSQHRLGATCRLDCLSKVSGTVHFDGGCKQRFFYYTNVNRCLLAGELNNTQARMAEALCINCNGCVKKHTREFNQKSAKSSVGDNSQKLPH
ncbi:hypothetical protein AKO1_001657 [Acrasis kona]|uniref:Apple domain-containing protein n=1 Tax=Acrasis kona TaxID=1008807 RepID=A0AAW2ZD98_9EUKA